MVDKEVNVPTTTANRRPCCGFWVVVTIALPVINTALVPVVAAYLGGLGLTEVSFALAAVLAAELYALRAWLRRLGVAPAGWITAAAGLIVAETGAILFVFLVIALSGMGD